MLEPCSPYLRPTPWKEIKIEAQSLQMQTQRLVFHTYLVSRYRPQAFLVVGGPKPEASALAYNGLRRQERGHVRALAKSFRRDEATGNGPN